MEWGGRGSLLPCELLIPGKRGARFRFPAKPAIGGVQRERDRSIIERPGFLQERYRFRGLAKRKIRASKYF